MVGQVGTEQMTGVAIVNQLIFVYNLCIFGGVSGAGIFTAQFFGQKDDEGVANTMRFKLYMGILLTGVTILLFLAFGEPLIQMYLKGNQDGGDHVAAALRYGKEYLGHYVDSSAALYVSAGLCQYLKRMRENHNTYESRNCSRSGKPGI